jgi:hypothetical protein
MKILYIFSYVLFKESVRHIIFDDKLKYFTFTVPLSIVHI